MQALVHNIIETIDAIAFCDMGGELGTYQLDIIADENGTLFNGNTLELWHLAADDKAGRLQLTGEDGGRYSVSVDDWRGVEIRLARRRFARRLAA